MNDLEAALCRIDEMQKGTSGTVRQCGNQLRDILREENGLAGQFLKSAESKDIKDCEGKIRGFALKNHGACGPEDADKIIREYFGLSARNNDTEAEPVADGTEKAGKIVSLDEFF